MSVINVEIEDTLKKQAENLFNNFGLNISSAINMLLEKVVNQPEFEFEKIIYNEQTRSALEECEKMKTNPQAYKHYKNFNQIVNEVLKDD